MATTDNIARIRIGGVTYQLKDSRLQANVTTKTSDEWYANSDYIPQIGEIVIFSDHHTKSTPQGGYIYVPDLKVGDGTTNIIDLPFLGSDNLVEVAKVAQRTEHTLTIGTYSFNGSADVSIPVYTGSYS